MAITDKMRIWMAVGAASFAAAMLVMLLVGYGYQRDMRLKDRELETLRGAHKNEIASLKRSHTIDKNKHERNYELLLGIDKKLDVRCER